MVDETRRLLLRQLDIAWSLTEFHLTGLDTDECLWRPAQAGLHIHKVDDAWHADWPEHEGYSLGPPSIAWVTWHIGFWWSMTLNHSFGGRDLRREDVRWPGSADGARAWIGGLHSEWREALGRTPDGDLHSNRLTRWPFTERPFADVAAWVNVELMKNAAEIGYARFLHATRS